MNIVERFTFSAGMPLLVAAGLLAACVVPAQAAIILVTKGVVAAGNDASGVFGAPSDLAGKPYKMTITYDDFSSAFHTSSPTFDKEVGAVMGPVAVTIGAGTFSPSVARSFGAMLYVNNNGAFSELTGFQSGNDAQGQNVYASHDLSSTSGVVAGPAIGMSAYTAAPGDVSSVTFRTSGPEGTASFSATSTGSWLVFPPTQLIAQLSAYIEGAALAPSGVATSLQAKLNAASSALAAGDDVGAVDALNDVVAEARAQSGKKIGTAQASEIIRQAQTTIETIGILTG